jgi:hypothetical protein
LLLLRARNKGFKNNIGMTVFLRYYSKKRYLLSIAGKQKDGYRVGVWMKVNSYGVAFGLEVSFT